MNKYLIASSIILIPTIASAFQTPEERISSSVSDISSIAEELRSLRDSAVSDKDTIRFTCIDDKHKMVSAALTQLLKRSSIHQSSDSESALHEATISEEILKKVRSAREEALLCNGTDLASDGDSQVSLELDGEVPGTDTVSFPIPPQVTEPPACASCFR